MPFLLNSTQTESDTQSSFEIFDAKLMFNTEPENGKPKAEAAEGLCFSHPLFSPFVLCLSPSSNSNRHSPWTPFFYTCFGVWGGVTARLLRIAEPVRHFGQAVFWLP
jgi:hypothetical protein